MGKKHTKATILAALRTLAENAGNVLQTARDTGIHRGTLTKWREKYNTEYVEIDRLLYRRWLIDARAAAVRQARARITKAGAGEAARVAKDMDGLLKLDGGEATERVEQTGGTEIVIRYEDATAPDESDDDAEA